MYFPQDLPEWGILRDVWQREHVVVVWDDDGVDGGNVNEAEVGDAELGDRVNEHLNGETWITFRSLNLFAGPVNIE